MAALLVPPGVAGDLASVAVELPDEVVLGVPAVDEEGGDDGAAGRVPAPRLLPAAVGVVVQQPLVERKVQRGHAVVERQDDELGDLGHLEVAGDVRASAEALRQLAVVLVAVRIPSRLPKRRRHEDDKDQDHFEPPHDSREIVTDRGSKRN